MANKKYFQHSVKEPISMFYSRIFLKYYIGGSVKSKSVADQIYTPQGFGKYEIKVLLKRCPRTVFVDRTQIHNKSLVFMATYMQFCLHLTLVL